MDANLKNKIKLTVLLLVTAVPIIMATMFLAIGDIYLISILV